MRRQLSLLRWTTFGIALLQSSSALPCEYEYGFHTVVPADGTRVPANAVVVAVGVISTTASVAVEAGTRRFVVDAEEVYNYRTFIDRPPGSAYSLSLQDVGIGNEPVTLSFLPTDSTFESEITARYQVSALEDMNPPTAPQILSTSRHWIFFNGCQFPHFESRFNLERSSDDFGVSHYRLVREDGVIIDVSTGLYGEPSLAAFRLADSADVVLESECYRIEVYDYAGNFSASPLHCLPERGAPPTLPDAGDIDTGAAAPGGNDGGQSGDSAQEAPQKSGAGESGCACSAAESEARNRWSALFLLGLLPLLCRRRRSA